SSRELGVISTIFKGGRNERERSMEPSADAGGTRHGRRRRNRSGRVAWNCKRPRTVGRRRRLAHRQRDARRSALQPADADRQLERQVAEGRLAVPREETRRRELSGRRWWDRLRDHDLRE